MDTQLDFKITTEYEVVGQGAMLTTPQQIGEWWVMPATQYTGIIPPEVRQKALEFLKENKVVGFLIADDMRDVKKHQELSSEKTPPGIPVGQRIGASILDGFFMVLTLMLGALASYDPMLIAVLPDGRWICLGSWWD